MCLYFCVNDNGQRIKEIKRIKRWTFFAVLKFDSMLNLVILIEDWEGPFLWAH